MSDRLQPTYSKDDDYFLNMCHLNCPLDTLDDVGTRIILFSRASSTALYPGDSVTWWDIGLGAYY